VKRVSWIAPVAGGAALLLCAANASADCKLVQIGELHVSPQHTTPVVEGHINGQPVKILLDTGATSSLVPLSEARRLNLRMGRLEGVHTYGFGGSTETYNATIKDLEIGGYKAANLSLLVAGGRSAPSDVSLILGNDFFSRADIEFDLKDGVVRLFDPRDCAPAQLVYWGAAYSQATLLPWERDQPKTETMVKVNGRAVLAQFDSGSDATIIDQLAAEAAGVSPAAGKPGAAERGIGRRSEKSWIGGFEAVSIGDEKLGNVRLQVVDFARDFTESDTGTQIPRRLDNTATLFIGADFFRAHRIFFDNKDHLVLFSYGGGPVFRPPEPPAP
jgi:predicted aspartyl protease